MEKCRIKDNGKCKCSDKRDADHILYINTQIKCRREDFITTTDILDKPVKIAAYCEGKGIQNLRPTRKEEKLTIIK